MAKAICPGCGESVSLEGRKVGDRIDCPNCANLTLRVKKRGEELHLEEIPKVSCPSCDRVMEIPEGLGAGDSLKCCGEEFIISYEFGAYALEKKSG